MTPIALLPTLEGVDIDLVVDIASADDLTDDADEACSAAEAGLIRSARSIATECGSPGDRCNGTGADSIRTASWDGRIAAEAVAFPSSDAARWITGTCPPVDGDLRAGNGPATHELQTDPRREPSP